MPEQNTPGGESGRTGETRTPENLKAIRNHFHSVQLKEPAFAAFFKEVYDNEETLFRFQQMEQQLPRFLEQYDAPLEEPRTNDNSIQRLKPFWATVINRPEDRAHLKLALQEAARTQSERIKAQLRDAETSGRPFYVHALTIGAGDHSAIFAARVRAARPDAKILSVTSASVVGGQFAEYDGPALRMNTGVISTTEGGQKVNPNPFGPDAPVQVSDVSSSYIADSEVAGLVGGIDQYLSTLTAMGLEFSAGHYNPGYKPNRFDSTSNPKDFDPKRDALYVSDFKDVQTGETYHIYSDYLPDAAGLGEENWGIEELSTDEESQRVIDVQQKRGIGKSRILTYQQFNKVVGNTTDFTPTARFLDQRVLVGGGSDAARTVELNLTLQGPGMRGEVAALGQIKSIVMVGGSIASRQDFQTQVAAPYQGLGPFMPDLSSATPELIRAIQHGRIIRIAQPGSENARPNDEKALDSPIDVYVRLPDKRVVMLTTDFAVFTTGFVDGTQKRLGDFLANSTFPKDGKYPDNLPIAKDANGRPMGRDVDPLHPGHALLMGPCGHLPAPADRLALAPMGLPTNPVSLYETEPATTAAADTFCAGFDQISNRPSSLNVELQGKIPFDAKDSRPFNGRSFGLRSELATQNLPEGIKDERLLTERLLAITGRYNIPDNTTFTFEVRSTPLESNGMRQYTLSGNYQTLAEIILADTWIQKVVARLTHQHGFPGRQITVRFPITSEQPISIHKIN